MSDRDSATFGQPDESEGIGLRYWPAINALYHKRFSQSGLVTQLFFGRGVIDREALGASLQVMQLRYPLLRCRMLEKQGQLALIPASPDQLPQLEYMTVHTHPDTAIVEQLMMEGVDERLWRVILVESSTHPRSWLLVMLCHHAICDARSTTLFLSGLLANYAERLSGTHSLTQPLPLQDWPKDLRIGEMGGAKVSEPPVESEWRLDYLVPLQQRRVRWLKTSFDASVLDSLREACRRERITVTNFITAALIHARNLAQTSRITTAMDLRLRVEPQISPEQFGCFIAMAESSVPWAEDIWELARNCAKYQLVNKDRVLSAALKMPLIPLLDMLMQDRLDKSMERGVFPGGIAITNLGVVPVPAAFGPLQIDAVHYTSPQLAGLYGMFLSALTFRGNLCINLSYAEPLLSSKKAEQIFSNFVGQFDCFKSS